MSGNTGAGLPEKSLFLCARSEEMEAYDSLHPWIRAFLANAPISYSAAALRKSTLGQQPASTLLQILSLDLESKLRRLTLCK